MAYLITVIPQLVFEGNGSPRSLPHPGPSVPLAVRDEDPVPPHSRGARGALKDKNSVYVTAHLKHGRISYASTPSHVRPMLRDLLAQGASVRENPQGFTFHLGREEVYLDFEPAEQETGFFRSLQDLARLPPDLPVPIRHIRHAWAA